MQRSTALVAAVASAALLSPATAGTISPTLDAILADSGADEIVSTLVYLDVQVDLDDLNAEFKRQRTPIDQRAVEVVTSLQAVAADTQGDLGAWLDARLTTDDVERVTSYWISNLFRVDATPDVIRTIARRNDVGTVLFNPAIESVYPVDGPGFGENAPDHNQAGGPIAGAVEQGVIAVRAPEVWALGYDGSGVLVCNIDTGVDGNHPALTANWAGTADSNYAGHPEWAWFDPYLGQNNFPYDSNGHGTHTMGTICGSAPGNGIGVAPGANWIAAGSIDRGGSVQETVADSILSFQWILDTDGNPLTTWDIPDVCSNSWGVTTSHGYSPCDETLWSFIDAAEAAGVVVLFAAGNEGTSGLRRPSDRATDEFRTAAVAAVDGNTPSYPIASFSSRGPTNCTPDGSSAIKPEISAPGVSVRSSQPGGGYGNLSGTSMATPHIAGVAALIRSANPGLPPDLVKQVMYETAADLGTPGNDNAYGFGMVDALAAVEAALQLDWLNFQLLSVLPELIDPNGGTTIDLSIDGPNSDPVPGSELLWYRADGGAFVSAALNETAPGLYSATLPAFDCGAFVEYYFAADLPGGGTAVFPPGAPSANFTGTAFSGEAIAFNDNGESSTGWSVENISLDDGGWDRGVPVGGGDRGDPANDYDGSGACWLTDNVDDNSDVDGGPTRLTSPAFDATVLADPTISYARWFTNDDLDADRLQVEISNNDGGSWVLLETVAHGPSWVYVQLRISDFLIPTAQMRLRFSATDNPNDSVTEAGIDALTLSEFFCEDTSIPGDVNGDGVVSFEDLIALLATWGPCGIPCPADFDGSGTVDFGDLLILLGAWS